MSAEAPQTTQIHGTCIAVDNLAALFVGASGTGKSAAALRMIAMGAKLIADDQVILTRKDDKVMATCPDGFAGMIEARGIGLLSVASQEHAQLKVIVDMEQTELHRLPPDRKNEILGLKVNTVFGRDNPVLEVGILALLRGERKG